MAQAIAIQRRRVKIPTSVPEALEIDPLMSVTWILIDHSFIPKVNHH